VRCSALQCVAVRTAVRCTVLQCVAAHCSATRSEGKDTDTQCVLHGGHRHRHNLCDMETQTNNVCDMAHSNMFMTSHGVYMHASCVCVCVCVYE